MIFFIKTNTVTVCLIWRIFIKSIDLILAPIITNVLIFKDQVLAYFRKSSA